MKDKDKKWMLFLLVAGLIGVYGFSDMKQVFYDVLRDALALSDLQLGRLWSAFGVAAMVSYLGGGFLTDRIAPSKLTSIALVLASAFHFAMAAVDNNTPYPLLLVISAGMGFCAVFLFFPASSKILTTMSRTESGSILGKYYGFGGAFTSIVFLAASFLYANVKDAVALFRMIMCFFGVINLLAGLLLVIRYWNLSWDQDASEGVRISDIPKVIKNPKVWLVALVIFGNYLVCCQMSYFTPYISTSFDVSKEAAMFIATVRLGIFCLVAGLLWGKMTSIYQSSKRVIGVSFIVLGALLTVLILNEITVHNVVLAVALTFGICLVTLGIKSIGLALLSEEDISPKIMGTVIGIVSFLGYSPDAIFYPIAGRIAESGSYAYPIIFSIGVGATILGFFAIRMLDDRGYY